MDNIGEYEGSVAPAFMHAQGRRQEEDFLHKLPLRLGRVVRVHAPKDSTSRSKYFFEYDVLVEDGSENKPSTRTLLPHCWMISDFGGAADFSRSTPRVLERDKNIVSKTDDLGYGARVLVIMINASAFAGVIVGGIQHSKGEVDDAAKGHHSIWQFNGIRREVDSKGQYTVSFKGATKADGTLESFADPAASGTNYSFGANGNWRVSTVDQDQFFEIDHETKIINLKANKDFKILSLGTFTWEAQGDASEVIGGSKNISVSSDFSTEVSGGYSVESIGRQTFRSTTSGISLNTPAGLVETTGLGVALGGVSAIDSMIKGTTYRVAEITMHATMIAGLSSASATLAAAGGTLASVATLHSTPVVGPVLAAVPLAAVAAQIAAAAASLATLAAAITTFESTSPSYLSLKNRLD